MDVRELSVSGAFSIRPRQFQDSRGVFMELYRSEILAESIGHQFTLEQMNCSVSTRGTLRGIHFADVPPGQAKYVACPQGAVLDVVVDIRRGSPTFGSWEAVRLDDVHRTAVYLAEGLGHAFLALSETATVVYLCSSSYNPQAEHGINPLDPELGITWPDEAPLLLSDRDRHAPSLGEAAAAGLLPEFDACRRHAAALSAAAVDLTSSGRNVTVESR